ncbi:MAG: nucleotidyltransferase substrate binding protein [Planctomycetes bacterium]|nr:nucleotidyltransferase substrate binding protein [Planctomycetota bacterium]
MNMKQLRWQQRYENFQKAFNLLSGAMENDLSQLSDLEKEGISQRFEFTFELAWKTMKDYMEHNGIVLDMISPKTVIKQAFASGVVEDGQVWIDMLESRNLITHTYDKSNLLETLEKINKTYLKAIAGLDNFLEKKLSDE